MFSRDQLKRAATLTEEDFVQLGKCRRAHNRLGFAYQVGFVRLFDRFPKQQPFELLEELVCFSAAQLELDPRLIERIENNFRLLILAQSEIHKYKSSERRELRDLSREQSWKQRAKTHQHASAGRVTRQDKHYGKML
jgi:hypothetical protein